MMTFMFIVVFSYMFFTGSFHSLFLLLVVEFMVLLCMYLIMWFNMVWVFCIAFLFFSVCISCYGVSLIIFNIREKGSFYSLSVKSF